MEKTTMRSFRKEVWDLSDRLNTITWNAKNLIRYQVDLEDLSQEEYEKELEILYEIQNYIGKYQSLINKIK